MIELPTNRRLILWKLIELLDLTDWLCVYCHQKLNLQTVTVDHAHARSDGGHSGFTNWLPSCSRCNGAKSNLTVIEFLRTRRWQHSDKPRAVRTWAPLDDDAVEWLRYTMPKVVAKREAKSRRILAQMGVKPTGNGSATPAELLAREEARRKSRQKIHSTPPTEDENPNARPWRPARSDWR